MVNRLRGVKIMSKDNEKLKEYFEKRDFNLSSEPKGQLDISKEKNVFVIQKHDASNLHYDFRLEVEGVLKSWVIPEDYYGAGEVINISARKPRGLAPWSVNVWDKGSYENTSKKDDTDLSMEEAIEKGHITINLKGKKLQGGYALIRTDSGEDARWLFIMMNDDQADARRNPVNTEPKSVISGKTIEDIKKEESD